MKTDTKWYLIMTAIIGSLCIAGGYFERGYFTFGGGEFMITLVLIAIYANEKLPETK